MAAAPQASLFADIAGRRSQAMTGIGRLRRFRRGAGGDYGALGAMADITSNHLWRNGNMLK